jgi:hypothetical protein
MERLRAGEDKVSGDRIKQGHMEYDSGERVR